MAWLDPLNNYCERTGIGLGSEPLNAISNLAFFIAAAFLWRHYRKERKDRRVAHLIYLIVTVGIGSTLSHLFANKLTLLMDIAPIALFTFYYLWVALRRLTGLPKMFASLCLILFGAVASQTPHVPEAYRFNNSVDYFPCLGALILIAVYLHKRAHPCARYISYAALVFAFSLVLRSIDYSVCTTLPMGTHFLWHTLNGFVLYLLTKAIIRVD